MHIQEVVLNAVIPVKLFGVTPGGIPPRTLLRRGRRPLPRRLPKPSTFRTLTPRHGGSEDQPLYGVARWLGRTAPYEPIVRGRLQWQRCPAFVAEYRLL